MTHTAIQATSESSARNWAKVVVAGFVQVLYVQKAAVKPKKGGRQLFIVTCEVKGEVHDPS